MLLVQRPSAALGAAADGARDVAKCRWPVAARQDEFLERRQFVVEVVERGFETFDVLGGNRYVTRQAEFAAEVEEFVLDGRERLAHIIRQVLREQHAERAVEFIERAVGFDAQVVFRHARAIAESGGAGVAGAGVNLA